MSIEMWDALGQWLVGAGITLFLGAVAFWLIRHNRREDQKL